MKLIEDARVADGDDALKRHSGSSSPRRRGRSQTLLYNPVRRHSTIEYVSPVEFERKAG